MSITHNREEGNLTLSGVAIDLHEYKYHKKAKPLLHREKELANMKDQVKSSHKSIMLANARRRLEAKRLREQNK